MFQGCYRSALKKMRNLINPLDQNQFDYAEILSITLRVAIAAARMEMAQNNWDLPSVIAKNTL